MATTREHKYLPPPSLEELGLEPPVPPGQRPSGDALPKPKKFRFQLLADYISRHFDTDTRIADVGGGKGLLVYLLQQRGYAATVIDPEVQALPQKYKDLATGRRVRIDPDASVPHIPHKFEERHAQQFELMVGLHAHGSNLLMLQAAAHYGRTALLLPCCVIGEPQTPPPAQSWFTWLAEQAELLGLEVEYFYLNFKGQNVGFVARSATSKS